MSLALRLICAADFEWCTINKTNCFLMPYYKNPCKSLEESLHRLCKQMFVVPSGPKEDVKVGDPKHENIELGGYWGCAYNEVNAHALGSARTHSRSHKCTVQRIFQY